MLTSVINWISTFRPQQPTNWQHIFWEKQWVTEWDHIMNYISTLYSILLLLFRKCCSRCRFQPYDCHYPLREVDSVHLQILSMDTCRQCGSWSVAGQNHNRRLGEAPFVHTLDTSKTTVPVHDMCDYSQVSATKHTDQRKYCYLNSCSPSSMAFFTARNPSWMASLICVSVCLFGPFMRIVTDNGFLHSSINVYFSSPCKQVFRCISSFYVIPQWSMSHI